MGQSIRAVDLDDVERAIAAGIRLLRFDPLLERQFDADTGADRCRQITRQNYVALAIYHCFLISDYRTVGDVFGLDLWMHFGVLTPCAIGVHLLLNRRPPAWIREGSQALVAIVLAMTITVVATSSRMPDRDSILLTLNLVVLFTILVLRIQFVYSFIFCSFVLIFHMYGLQSFEKFSSDRVVMLNFFMLALTMFSLVGSYTLEREQRMGFLLTLRDRLRHRRLEIASLRDTLTGVGNRRALEADLERLAVPSASVPSRPSMIALLDVDHFKAFNDANGHQAGDGCLRRIAELVSRILGEDGAVYRYGGEEFLVIFDAESARDAAAVGERIRSAVAGARIPRDAAGTTFVTISVGIACGCVDGRIALDALIAAADGALYAAKRDGRDRVRCASGAGVASPVPPGAESMGRGPASGLQEGIGAALVA